MTISKYTRFGLRADRNLSDLSDPSVALTNVLDDFIPGESFTPGDLTVINGLKSTNLFASGFAQLANSEVTYTPVVTDTAGNISLSTVTEVAQPLVRVADLVKSRKVVLGDPPYRRGGSGPNATIVPSIGLQSTAGQVAHSGSNPVDSVFDVSNANGYNIVDEDYWLDGRFAFSDSLYPTFDDSFGALSWDGWISNPERRGIRITTNAFYIFEKWIPETSSWATLQQVSQEAFTIETNGTGNSELEGIPLTTQSCNHLCVGMTITLANGSTFEVISVNGNSMNVEHRSGATTSLTFGSGDTFNVSWAMGLQKTIESKMIFTEPMLKGETKRHRFTVWYPKPDSFAVPKTVITYAPLMALFDLSDNGAVGDDTPYVWWYKTKQGDPTIEPPMYTFQHFKRNHINAHNKKTSYYVQNESPIYMNYAPVLDTDLISRYNSSNSPTTTILQWRGDNTFTTPSGQDSSSIQVGDYLLFTGHQPVSSLGGGNYDTTEGHYYLQVVEKEGETVYTDPYVENDMDAIMTHYSKSVDDQILFFAISNKGLLTIMTSVLSGTVSADADQQITCQPLLNTKNGFTDKDVSIGDLGVNLTSNAAGTTGREHFRKISNITNQNVQAPANFTTNSIQPGEQGEVFDGAYVLVYAHKGLTDLSTRESCVGVYGREVVGNTTLTGGTTTIPVDSATGIYADAANGDYVQFDGRLDPNVGDPVIPTGAFVESVDTSSNPNTITISAGITAGKTLNPAATLVFVPRSNTTGGNLEYCVLPLNTAPPFAGTDLGLETISTHPHLSVNGKFKITGFEIANTTSAPVADSAAATADSALRLRKPTTASSWDSFDDFYVLMKDV